MRRVILSFAYFYFVQGIVNAFLIPFWSSHSSIHSFNVESVTPSLFIQLVNPSVNE